MPRDTPHPSELVSTSVAALSHKGRGHINAHLAFLAPRSQPRYAAAVIGRGLTTYSRSTLSLPSTSISATS
ncbi:hypothetical protein FXB38_30815 [Bradyrhizobium cytisi]|uniref:Uncharacterized protein n=1 Tax=Bradyrhizobium cytisi TaxID=515489 RepID=A0A5S4W725_9BRAD|nr:hypothetical protein FXB38_30815 [Bradyrhizobium cytisi]